MPLNGLRTPVEIIVVQSVNRNTAIGASDKSDVAQILKNRQHNRKNKTFLDKASSIIGSLMSQKGAKAAVAVAVGASYWIASRNNSVNSNSKNTPCLPVPKHPIGFLESSVVNKVLQEIDQGELPLFTQNGQVCAGRKLAEDISISRDSIQQSPDGLNCAIAATLMAVAEKDPVFIPRIISTKSTSPMIWSVQLHKVDANKLQINVPVKVDVSENELHSSRYANLYVDNSYKWPALLSVAIDKVLRSSSGGKYNGINNAATSHIMSTLFGKRSVQAQAGVLPADLHLPPRQLAKKLINQWYQLSQSIPGNVGESGMLSKPCTFGFLSEPSGAFRDQPDFYPGHAFALEGFDMSDKNNPQMLLRQPYDLKKPIDAANKEDRIVRVGANQLERYLSNPKNFIFDINVVAGN